MDNTITQFEARAYKKLFEIYRETLNTIVNTANNKSEYSSDDKEELLKEMQYIANKNKWDYCGFQSKIQTAVIKELEACLHIR